MRVEFADLRTQSNALCRHRAGSTVEGGIVDLIFTDAIDQQVVVVL